MSRDSVGIGDVLRGGMAGMIGGAVASWAMNQFQAARPISPPRPRPAAPAEPRGAIGKAGEHEGDDATIKTAQALSRGLFAHELTPQEMKVGGPAVHYAYGTLVGGLYGALAEVLPIVGSGFGIPYAFALFLLGDEVAVPALGLGGSPLETPAEKHADALATHLAYGVTLDVVRRFARHVV